MAPTTPIPMRSRSVQLRPPTDRHLDRIYHLACQSDIAWDWRGRRESPTGFRESLLADLLAMFAIVDRRTEHEVGLVRALEFHPLHRYVYMSTALLPAYQGRVWPLEGALLFANYLFVKYDLRHIYGRATEGEWTRFRSGDGRYFELEAQLKAHLIINSEPQDHFILTLSKEMWMSRGLGLLERHVHDR